MWEFKRIIDLNCQMAHKVLTKKLLHNFVRKCENAKIALTYDMKKFVKSSGDGNFHSQVHKLLRILTFGFLQGVSTQFEINRIKDFIDKTQIYR